MHTFPHINTDTALTIILLVRQRRDTMHTELLLQSLVEPDIMFVASADSSATARGNHTVGHEALDPLKLLLLRRVLYLNGKGVGIGVPHGNV